MADTSNTLRRMAEQRSSLPTSAVDPEALEPTSELVGAGGCAKVYGSRHPKVSRGLQHAGRCPCLFV